MRPHRAHPSQVRSVLPRWVDPSVAFSALYGGETDVVWLDSGPSATTGVSVIGRAARVLSSEEPEGAPSVIDELRENLARDRPEEIRGFALGWVGWLGYETRFETMRTERTRVSPYPDAAFLFLDRAIEFDHANGTVSLLSLGEDAAWRAEVETALESASGHPAAARSATASPAVATWRDTDAEYLDKIANCQDAIRRGDAYLLCLTTSVDVAVRPDPLATYLALRESSPSHHGALLRIGDVALLSSSPERFLSVTPDGVVESRPIKGTRPRGATADLDRSLADELAASEKERAENLMIVDLMRNDIAKVSAVGSIEVPSLLRVESYAQVHQLVSSVRGHLADGMSGLDAVVACFPGGSMTGTPKSSATRILDRLEGAPRGIYSGAFGYFGLDGRVDLAMVIRSIVLAPSGASIGSGGGITILSDPVEELAEVKLKAAALLAVLGVS